VRPLYRRRLVDLDAGLSRRVFRLPIGRARDGDFGACDALYDDRLLTRDHKQE
jgi:hypothetical protein